MIPCKLTLPPDSYRQVSICLNRVHLRGLTIDEAMKKLAQLGFSPKLRYQWNPKRQEIDVFALICEEPIEEMSITDEQDKQLWNIFGNETVLYVLGCEADRDEDWLARWDLEQDVPPPPKTTQSTEVAA
ncbi:MAG: hypothetical protein LDL41_19800 [Coleofasciculus sp. S288]|nr:hypothetical protein [Coleofasciculus sp. S288]